MNYPRSAYLHIPFCHRRCFYCDFPVVPLGDKASGGNGPGSSSIKSYLEVLHREILLVDQGKPLSTIYIGGGTPSLLIPEQVVGLLDLLKLRFGFLSGIEITLEIDPASFDEFSLRGYVDAGVNRFSLGAQSFDDNVLHKLGRRHTVSQLNDACNLIADTYRKGYITSWSLDLIQNLPGQGLLDWEKQLLKAIEFSPPHLSVYDLSIEEGTVFSWKIRRGEMDLPSHEISSDISKLTSQILRKKGFSRYEISNYAIPGHASRHNRVYWSGANWWAFGLGATSCLAGKRYSRPRKRKEYEKWVKTQELHGKNSALQISNHYQSIPFDELLIVGLRRREGIDFRVFGEALGWDEKNLEANILNLKMRWKDQLKMGLIKESGYRFCLTDPDGMELSNQILVETLIWWDSLNNYSSL